MAKEIEKSKAELYREERKERIAKANKKNAKNIEKTKKAAGIAKKVVAIVLVAAIVIGIGTYVVFTTGTDRKLATAVKVGDAKVNAVVYNYYYYSMYQQVSYYAQMYSQYGYDMGYDTSESPDEQTTEDEDGNEITWAEYFRKQAIDRAQYVEAYYAEAKKANLTLTDDEKSEIEETVKNYSDSASENGYTLSAYLQAIYGAGFTEKVFRAQLEKEQLASAYQEKNNQAIEDAVTDEEISAEYTANQKDYDYVDVTYYVFTGTILTAEDGESDDDLAARQKEANEKLLKEVEDATKGVKDAATLETAVSAYVDSKKTDETADTDAEAADTTDTTDTTETDETAEEADTEDEEDEQLCTESKHIKYEDLSTATNAVVADWAFADDTKAGSYKILNNFDDGNDVTPSVYFVILNKAHYDSNSVSVRQILVQFVDTDGDSDNVTDDEKAETLKTAEEIKKEWEDGDATEDSFAALATEKTEDEGSQDNGGLYENIRISDSYVDPFLDWSFDSSRKAGDCEIIETEYGYHIMYFVSDNTDDLDSSNTIRENIAKENQDAADEKLLADDGAYKVVASDYWTNRIMKLFCKQIKQKNAQSSSES